MKQLKNYISNNKLLKVASLNSVSIGVKIITGFLTSKAIAFFIGAEGLALIGNLRNFLSSIQSISTLGVYSGIVKYVSEFKNNVFKLSKIVSSVSYAVLFTTLLVSIFCYFNADYLSRLIFSDDTSYAYIIKIIAFALPFYSFQVLFLSIINGLSRYKRVLTINIIGQVLVGLITLFLIWKYQLKGALIAISIGEALVFFITLFWVYRDRKFFKLTSVKKIDLLSLKNLGSYSVMGMYSAIILPIVIVLIRNYIIDNLSLQDAGFWEAMRRLSGYYFMFVSTLLTLYVLPTYSKINTIVGFRKEVFNFYKTIVPVFAIGLIVIYFLRTFIVVFVFSDEFIPVEGLFGWQLLGDFVRLLSLVISYQLVAKKMFWQYIITETLSYATLYFVSIYCIDKFGLSGVTMAHCITYTIYFIIILLIFWRPLFGKLPKEETNK